MAPYLFFLGDRLLFLVLPRDRMLFLVRVVRGLFVLLVVLLFLFLFLSVRIAATARFAIRTFVPGAISTVTSPSSTSEIVP